MEGSPLFSSKTVLSANLISPSVPLYGRGMTSSSSSAIPQRPALSPLNNLINSALSLNPSFQHHLQAQSPRHYGGFTATESSTDLANAVMMSFLYRVIRVFGEMVYTSIFVTLTNTSADPVQNVRLLNENIQRMVQLQKYLDRTIFFLCCTILCLFSVQSVMM